MINNYLSAGGFKIQVKRLPHVEFFSNKVLLPSVTTNSVKSETPLRSFYSVGDHINYADLDLTFIVDENMNNYIEIYSWLKAFGPPETLASYDKLNKSIDGLTSDISIIILNSQKNPNIEATFTNCFPVGITPVSLDLSNADVSYVEATVTVRYDQFDIKQLS